MVADVPRDVDSVRRQCVGVEEFCTADGAAAMRVGTGVGSVLDRQRQLRVPEPFPKLVQDAAVPGGVAVPVAQAVPDADRSEVLGVASGDQPLGHRVVAFPAQPDLAGGPVLGAGPLDASHVVVDLARRHGVEISRRAPGPAGVHTHAHVAGGHPHTRVDDLPHAVVPGRGVLGRVRVEGVGQIGALHVVGQGVG